jgi:hypothetical protein
MTRAEELFARIAQRGAAEIHSMITNKVVEELFLDYKRSATLLPSAKLADDDRKNLAKAISGFGNSDGGVIVWGVDCRNVHGEGDVPTGPVRISLPTNLKTLIDGAVGGLTVPSHAGVETVALVAEDGVEGFVVTLVRAGIHMPYAGAVKGADNYFMRAGSSFLPVPHSLLAGMFGRRPQPVVRGTLASAPPQWDAGGSTVRLHFDLILRNEGRGMAKDLFALVQPTDGGRVHARKHHWDSDRWEVEYTTGWPWTLVARPGRLILPPGAHVSVCGLMYELYKPTQAGLSIEVTCGAEGCPSHSFAVRIQPDDISDLVSIATSKFDDFQKANVAIEKISSRIGLPLGF